MIKQVNCYIGPNQISEGFYTIDDSKIAMVYLDGQPVMINDTAVEHFLRDGENEETIAKMLTRRIRSHFRGSSVEGFDRQLEYPRTSVA